MILWLQVVVSKISIHAPARGATPGASEYYITTAISIHAPARGATLGINVWDSNGHIFQSTLPHGERPQSVIYLPAYKDFNPRSRTGSDEEAQTKRILVVISIHAPARGATCIGYRVKMDVRFQSTLPHGERQGHPRPTPSVLYFNPRSRTGSDLHGNCTTTAYKLFQSTLPHGERPQNRQIVRHHRQFQSTLPHGERPRQSVRIGLDQKFQSTLPHGERPGWAAPIYANELFQSTLPHGERPAW